MPPNSPGASHNWPKSPGWNAVNLFFIRKETDGQPCFDIQHCGGGHNVTEYIPRHLVPVVREHTAIFKSAARPVGQLLWEPADKIDAASSAWKDPVSPAIRGPSLQLEEIAGIPAGGRQVQRDVLGLEPAAAALPDAGATGAN